MGLQVNRQLGRRTSQLALWAATYRDKKSNRHIDR